MNTLRALVRSSEDGGCEAQLLELDIAVHAANEDALLRQLEYILTAEYTLAMEAGLTPFANMVKATPQAFHDGWEASGLPKVRPINLGTEVVQALAIALHTPKLLQFAVQPLRIAA